MNRDYKPTKPLVITPGEPAGIGPEITLQAAMHFNAPLVVFADRYLLEQRAQQLGLKMPENLQVQHIPLAVASQAV